jgi:hypothetical protein
LEAADFAKAGGYPYSFHWWAWKATIPTVCGPFELELRTGDGCPAPDTDVLAAAESLVATLQRLESHIIDIVLGHYRWHLIRAPDWLTEEGIPLDLTRDRIGEFVRDRALVVTREQNEASTIEQCIHVTPLWDIEHALDLVVQGGQITTVNDTELQLEGGILQSF